MSEQRFFVCMTVALLSPGPEEVLERLASRKDATLEEAVRVARRLRRRMAVRLGRTRMAIVEVIDARFGEVVWREAVSAD